MSDRHPRYPRYREGVLCECGETQEFYDKIALAWMCKQCGTEVGQDGQVKLHSSIEVVSAVIVSVYGSNTAIPEPRVLLTQRTANRDFPCMWESPGGKVEQGEHPRAALARELTEEIGLVNPEIAQYPFFTTHFDNIRTDSRPVSISFYVSRLSLADVPSLREVAGLGWFTLTDMLAMRNTLPGTSLIPGNVRLVDYLFEESTSGPRATRHRLHDAEKMLLSIYNAAFRF